MRGWEKKEVGEGKTEGEGETEGQQQPNLKDFEL